MTRLDQFHQKHRQIDDAISKYFQSTRERIGFAGKIGGAALPTNVWPKWRSGKWVIVIAAEMDSLLTLRQRRRDAPVICLHSLTEHVVVLGAMSFSLDKLSSKPLDFPPFQLI